MRISKSVSLVCLIGSVLFLAGCGGTGVVDSTLNTIEIEPGSNAKCPGSPCQVFFMLPPLDGGKYEISGRTDNRGVFYFGSFRAGTRAYLGKLRVADTTDYAIVVEGTQLEVAYLTVVGTRESR